MDKLQETAAIMTTKITMKQKSQNTTSNENYIFIEDKSPKHTYFIINDVNTVCEMNAE